MDQRADEASPRLGHLAAVVAGNALGFYDFITFALFAVYIGDAFFPSHDKAISLLASLATFGAGFITRPIGAVVLGGLGDRIGRRPAMLVSFVLIGLGMAGIALTPSFASIGIAAPILVILFRLLQGFGLGGDVGPTTAYMVEAAPAGRRGVYGALQGSSQSAAVLLGGLVGTGLAAVLRPADLAAWGWRIAFLAGVVIVPFGIWARRRLPETLMALEPALAAAPPRRVDLLAWRKPIIIGFVLLIAATVGTYVVNYMTTFALDTLKMGPSAAFGVTIVTSLVGIVSCQIGGSLSDRYGRKPVILYPTLVLAPVVLGGFWLIARFPSVLVFYGAMGVIAAIANLNSPVLVALTESLPPRVRSGAVATVYALAISVFGGTTQFALKWLLHTTHNSMVPGWYMAASVVIGIPFILWMDESAPLARRAPPAAVAEAAA